MVHLLSGLNYHFSYIGIPVLGWRTTMTLHTEYQYACFVNVWSRKATLEKVLVKLKYVGQLELTVNVVHTLALR